MGKFFFLFRTMYWADWGNHPKIETAAMDGTLRQTLVHENIQWPTGQYSTEVDTLIHFVPVNPLMFLPTFCVSLYRFGCGLLQRASVLGRCQTLGDRQCPFGRLWPCHCCVGHQKQLSSPARLEQTWIWFDHFLHMFWFLGLSLWFQTCFIHSA